MANARLQDETDSELVQRVCDENGWVFATRTTSNGDAVLVRSPVREPQTLRAGLLFSGPISKFENWLAALSE